MFQLTFQDIILLHHLFCPSQFLTDSTVHLFCTVSHLMTRHHKLHVCFNWHFPILSYKLLHNCFVPANSQLILQCIYFALCLFCIFFLFQIQVVQNVIQILLAFKATKCYLLFFFLLSCSIESWPNMHLVHV